MKNLQELSLISDRVPLVYLEHAKLNVHNNNLQVKSKDATYSVPIDRLLTLVLGPGTSITHETVKILYTQRVQIVWMGADGINFYASAVPLTYKSENILKQAKAWADLDSRQNISLKMFKYRFGDIDKDTSIENMRTQEGIRVKDSYRKLATEYNVLWNGRNYDPQNPDDGDLINRLITMSNSFLYSVVHAVIISCGYSPSIGFVHTGNVGSFVFDIADLYKTQYATRTAFQAASAISIKDHFATLRELFLSKINQNSLVDLIIFDLDKLFV